MAGFLYFWAGGTGELDAENVDERVGLGYAFDGSVASREVHGASHPCGKPGLVIGDPNGQPVGKSLGMYGDQQQWRKMPVVDGGPDLWIGYWIDHKPKPADLRRAVSLRTRGVLLDDGQYWDVPIVCHREDERLLSDLPAYLTFDERGRRIPGETVGEFRSLWDRVSALADKAFAHVLEPDANPAVTDDEQWEATVSLLAATHRVGPIELLVLQTFIVASPTFGWVWDVATRYDDLMQALDEVGKKKDPSAPSGESSSAGSAA